MTTESIPGTEVQFSPDEKVRRAGQRVATGLRIILDRSTGIARYRESLIDQLDELKAALLAHAQPDENPPSQTRLIRPATRRWGEGA